jgi:DNA-binding winged helix-turn-helix (wHTH) protein
LISLVNETLAKNDVYAFGPCALDIHRGTLSRGGDQVFLRPKAFSLIHHLAQNMGRVVPKSELLDAVWPGIFVTEDSLTQSIREIRKARGRLGRAGHAVDFDPRAKPANDCPPVLGWRQTAQPRAPL